MFEQCLQEAWSDAWDDVRRLDEYLQEQDQWNLEKSLRTVDPDCSHRARTPESCDLAKVWAMDRDSISWAGANQECRSTDSIRDASVAQSDWRVEPDFSNANVSEADYRQAADPDMHCGHVEGMHF